MQLQQQFVRIALALMLCTGVAEAGQQRENAPPLAGTIALIRDDGPPEFDVDVCVGHRIKPYEGGRSAERLEAVAHASQIAMSAV